MHLNTSLMRKPWRVLFTIFFLSNCFQFFFLHCPLFCDSCGTEAQDFTVTYSSVPFLLGSVGGVLSDFSVSVIFVVLQLVFFLSLPSNVFANFCILKNKKNLCLHVYNGRLFPAYALCWCWNLLLIQSKITIFHGIITFIPYRCIQVSGRRKERCDVAFCLPLQ